jgi:3,4-dihydroxy 2-butanone 4-phosphate synthase
MNQSIVNAIDALQNGQGVIVVDDYTRENEADIIFSAQHLTSEQMALLIRKCSGIVCLCLTSKKIDELNLPMMTAHNHSKFQTAFTVSIEAKEGVTTGVSAKDRVTTIKEAISKNGATRIVSPGHVFPLKAQDGGVLTRRGHTEASIDLMKLAQLEPYAVLCELTNDDGSMAISEQITQFSKEHNMPLLSVEEIVQYRLSKAS